MEQDIILLATTNAGKLKEIEHFFSDSKKKIITLNDLDTVPEDPEETEPTLEGNALLKAKYYATHTGYITLADDTGLFIDALDGWPGVRSARVAPPNDGQVEAALAHLQGVPQEKRTAYFETILAVHDPRTGASHIFTGKTHGRILEAPVTENIIHYYGYNRIFYVEEAGKTFAEMDLPEKNTFSQRGKALIEAKRFFTGAYGVTQYIVPLGIVIRDGNILINKRHDPHNEEYHHKWEFPGGGIEFGESIEENLVREIKEETGYDIRPVKRLSYIDIQHRRGTSSKVQILLLPYICEIIRGDLVLNDAEVAESKWASPKDVLSYDLIGKNKELYQHILPEIEAYITNHA